MKQNYDQKKFNSSLTVIFGDCPCIVIQTKLMVPLTVEGFRPMEMILTSLPDCYIFSDLGECRYQIAAP